MLQLILHGMGDYILQTDTQALNKKNKGKFGLICCLQHCITYTLPFLFITKSPFAILAIFLSHFAIDRTRIIDHLLAWKNGVSYITNFGFHKDKPFALSIWLYIITDNICHLICNYLAIKYL
jgi:hypothetical protein